MTRLLLVSTVPSTMECFLSPFARYFRAKGWRVDAAAQNVSSSALCLRDFDGVWDIQWSRNPLNISNLMRAPDTIRNAVSGEKYDLVHVHTPVAAFATRYALRKLRRQGKVKVIYTAHGFHFYRGGHPIKNAIFLTLEKISGKWTDYLVVINHEDEEAAKRYKLVPQDKIVHIPASGVDFTRFCPEAVTDEERTAVRNDLGISPEDPLFLMVGAFIPRKRPKDALQAFARLKSHKAHLAFAGDGPLMGQMKQLATDLGISDRVHFLGHREDIPMLISASTSTLLTSSQEGLSGCVTESLGMEVPVVGTDVRGVRELLGNGCGYLAPLGDFDGIAGAMQQVLDHPEEAKERARLGRSRVAVCDVRCILESYEKLYTRALSEV